MEDELTCPVCLELYADPLMLPCSHSVCKKCLQDICDSSITKLQSEKGVECPSCRKSIDVERDQIGSLPRNLALENIVIRYTEERSKSIRKSLSMDSPVSDLLISPVSESAELPEFPTSSLVHCEMCETSSPSRAAWHCIQCEVLYCHSCFAKYHPRKGALARHKVRPPHDHVQEAKPLYCKDHNNEVASIFCDVCNQLICSLCVCDGDGQHCGHKVLAPHTACAKIKDVILNTKQKSESLLRSLREQQGKVETLSEDLQEVHKEACRRIEHQYDHLITNLKDALTLEKKQILTAIKSTKSRCSSSTKSYLEDNEQEQHHLVDIAAACDDLGSEVNTRATLTRAEEVQPLVQQLDIVHNKVQALSGQCESVVKEKKSATVELQSGVEHFRCNANKTLTALLGNEEDCEVIIPHIQSPATCGTSESSPRIQNKCLSTWGFSSTTFSGEPISGSTSWTVTIERNTAAGGSHLTSCNTGYLFGIGVSSEVLTMKELVGMCNKSHGLMCSEGAIYYSHNGQQEHIVTLPALPLSITLSVRCHHSSYTILTYKLAPSGECTSLVGRKILTDAKLKDAVLPVFSVSQRVKLLFPTFV